MERRDARAAETAHPVPGGHSPYPTLAELEREIDRAAARYSSALRHLDGASAVVPISPAPVPLEAPRAGGRRGGRRAALPALLVAVAVVLGVGVVALLPRRSAFPQATVSSAPAAVAPATPVARSSPAGGVVAAATSVPAPTAAVAPPATAPPAPTATAALPAATAALPTATVTPIVATPIAVASPAPPAPAGRERVAAVELALRTGQFEVALDYGGGNRSAVRVRFDLGAAGRPRRLHLISSYQASSGGQVIEQIAIAEQTWRRQSGGGWETATSQDGFWEQLQTYLPRVPAGPDVRAEPAGALTILRWYDADTDMDLTLYVDSATAIPQRLAGRARASGLELAVTYAGWNVPVTIEPPVTP